MTLSPVTIVVLGAFLALLLTGFGRVFVAIARLQDEKAHRDAQLSLLTDELDVRLKRMAAREDHWRRRALMAERGDEPKEPEAPSGTGETPLQARQRLRGY